MRQKRGHETRNAITVLVLTTTLSTLHTVTSVRELPYKLQTPAQAPQGHSALVPYATTRPHHKSTSREHSGGLCEELVLLTQVGEPTSGFTHGWLQVSQVSSAG